MYKLYLSLSGGQEIETGDQKFFNQKVESIAKWSGDQNLFFSRDRKNDQDIKTF